MKFSTPILYTICFFSSFFLSLVFTPLARLIAIKLNIFDHPISSVKTHKKPTPYLGGLAIFCAFFFSLFLIRLFTEFPSGTLRTIRGIIFGSLFILMLGLIDDVKYTGLHYRTKFLFQIFAAFLVIIFGVNIQFIKPFWLGHLLTLLWIVGITNAFNLIDIMDGLASGVVIVVSLAFLFISLPTEAIYVNFSSAALAGACLGFIPYNLSQKYKLFMGDTGSLVLGFICASLSMGTSYGDKTEIAVFAPLLLLAIPIYDTLLVFYLRIRKGKSPFLGSKDHFPLRLEQLGWSRSNILIFILTLNSVFCLFAFFITQTNVFLNVFFYLIALVILSLLTRYVLKVEVK
ncbi:MAG: MraY family glycosyltransferase [Elusimicrobiota bacterium]